LRAVHFSTPVQFKCSSIQTNKWLHKLKSVE
jgi:hypothetical protein